MKKYFLLLTLIPFSANGALSLLTQLPRFARLVHEAGSQRALLSNSKQRFMPIKPTPMFMPIDTRPHEAVLREAVLRDLDEQKIALTDIDPNEEMALHFSIKSLLTQATYYNKHRDLSVSFLFSRSFSWLPRNETVLEIAAYLRSLE